MPTNNPDKLAAVILAGGRSRRMGVDKASLPFGASTFLDEVVKRIEASVGQIMVVGNAQQPLQAFELEKSPSIQVAFDKDNSAGPLEGIRVGLSQLAGAFDFAFVTSCDVPLLHPQMIPFLFGNLESHQAVMPFSSEPKRVFGMTAIYRTNIHEDIRSMLNEGKRRVSCLAEGLDCKLIPIEEIRSFDPELKSLININEVSDYMKLLKQEGLEIPDGFKSSQDPTTG